MSIDSLPYELWEKIFSFVDIYTISTLQKVNVFFYKMIQYNKWQIIDIQQTKISLLIPSNKETFLNYKYCIPWTHYISNKTTINEHVLEWLFDIIDNSKIECFLPNQLFSENIIRKIYKRDFDSKIKYEKIVIDKM